MSATHSPTHPHHRHAGAAAVALTAGAVLLLGACGSSGYGSSGSGGNPYGAPATTTAGTSAGPGAVTISGFAFSPAKLSVKHGTKVTVTNNDTATHTWTADSGDTTTWTSPDLAPGDTYSFTFTKAGTFSYHCKIHPSMHGTITVS